MANGRQKTYQNFGAFEVWHATQTDDDFLTRLCPKIV